MELIDLACPLCAMRISGNISALEKERTCPRCKEWVTFVRSEEVPEIDTGPSVKHQAAQTSKTLLAGGIAALIGALIWALVGAYLNLEIGYLAWGIGLGIGFTVALVGGKDIQNKGLMAAGLTTGSLLIAKLFFFFLVIPMEVNNLWSEDEEFRSEITHLYLVDKGVITELEGEEYDPEELEAEELDLYLANQSMLETRLENMTPNEENLIKENYVAFLDNLLTFSDKLFMSVSLFDILWLFLGISSAYKVAENS